MAGALAIATLSLVEVFVAVFPLRRGEIWAFWTTALPLITLVLPMLILDARHVAPGHRLGTLAPFVLGLLLAVSGLTMAWTARI